MSANETALSETPAARAMSLMVTRLAAASTGWTPPEVKRFIDSEIKRISSGTVARVNTACQALDKKVDRATLRC
ncbi:hypothetical protein GCM10010452_26880 [Crossiella cryophila]